MVTLLRAPEARDKNKAIIIDHHPETRISTGVEKPAEQSWAAPSPCRMKLDPPWARRCQCARGPGTSR